MGDVIQWEMSKNLNLTMPRHYTPETTLTDYKYLEKREEEDLPASKTPLTHPYNDSKTT